jgi:RHS repeat-associated protein
MASTQITQRCTYRYDPLDRLINQTQPDTPTHQRFYCKSRLATEIQGATKHSIIQHDDLLLAQQQREGDALDTTLLITDLQRSVLHTLKKATQPQPIAYSPYGHRPAFNGLLSLLGFNGERPDPVTGHYLLGNGYRAFNPVLMRFNSPDSLSPFGKGGLNPYTYCLGDPINLYDQNGRQPLTLLSRFLNWLKKPFHTVKPTYKSEIGKTVPDYFTEIIFRDQEGNALNIKQILTTTENGITASHTTITTPGLVKSIDRNGFTTLKKRNTTLLDLTFSKIPGYELEDGLSRLGIRTDPNIERFNLLNARQENLKLINRNANAISDIEKTSSYDLTNLLAIDGALHGIRPSQIIKNIRTFNP